MTTGKTIALTKQEKKKVSWINKEEMELKLQKTGKGIVNENGMWEVKPEGGKVQREGRELHSSTWPSAPISRPQRLGGVGCRSESNISSHRCFLLS